MESTRPQSSPPPVPGTGNADTRERQPESRTERLARIRREIEAGTYETPDKLEQAIDRLFGVLID